MTIFGFTTIAGRFVLLADWTEMVVPAVVFTIWVINQIAGANKNKPPAAPRPQAPGQGGANPKQARGPLEEVEQFLREARKAMENQQRAPQAPPPQQQQRPAGQKSKQQRSQKQGAKKQEKPVARKSLSEQTRLKPQAADRELDEVRLGGSVSQHVQQHLGGRFDDRPERLSRVNQEVDQDIGAHVKSVFDHQVGSLAVQRDAVADASDAAGAVSDAGNPAAQVVAMLRDPQSLRNAIILQEILQPPTHRW